MFSIREKVVCVNPIYNLIKYEIYKIEMIYPCPCGILGVDLNIKKIAPDCVDLGISLCDCGRIVNSFNVFGIHRFRKLDYAHTENIIREICESVKEEELELVAK